MFTKNNATTCVWLALAVFPKFEGVVTPDLGVGRLAAAAAAAAAVLRRAVGSRQGYFHLELGAAPHPELLLPPSSSLTNPLPASSDRRYSKNSKLTHRRSSGCWLGFSGSGQP